MKKNTSKSRIGFSIVIISVICTIAGNALYTAGQRSVKQTRENQIDIKFVNTPVKVPVYEYRLVDDSEDLSSEIDPESEAKVNALGYTFDGAYGVRVTEKVRSKPVE